jgi:hypothetical protein
MTRMSENRYPTFEPGQRVRTCYGQIRAVLFQRGSQVFVLEEPSCRYHPTKLAAIAAARSAAF